VYDEDDYTIQGQVQVIGSNLNGIYKLDTVQKMAHAAASEKKMQRLQYRRLCHLCRKSIKLLAGMTTGTEFSDIDDEPCTAFIKVKHSMAVFKCTKYRAMQQLGVNSFRYLWTKGRGKLGRSEVHAHSHT
jgi:hypothetical protein